MHLTILHITEYRYPEPAWDSFNELRVFPVDDDRQSLLSFRLQVRPEATLRSHIDYFGSRVHRFHVADPHRELYIESASLVVTHLAPWPLPVGAGTLGELRPRFFEYLAPTPRVPLGHNWLAELGADALRPEDDLVEYLKKLASLLHRQFTYRPNATRVDTPLLEFARAKAGVCQDYAHAMLAVCRSVGIPARYVSGYLYTGGSDSVGGDASHAWVEAHVPGSGWVGFDPTNGTEVAEAYVKVGHGRDYDDVPPLKGLRRGGGTEALRVAVGVTRRPDGLGDTGAR
jgi:transglutaminase-like putative cysteine protease